MKRWKAVAFAALILVSLSQIPFVYGRLQIGALSRQISDLAAARKPHTDPRYREYTGVLHVHTALGGHSRATFDELIDGAQGLDFVVITEHTADFFDTASLTLNGKIGGTLFVGGNEVNTVSDRFLLIPGSPEAFARRMSESMDFVSRFQKQGKLAFVTYPETFKSWDSSYDGIEVFNLNTSATQWNGAWFLLQAFWTYRSQPELTIASFLSRPDANLRGYDEAARRRRVTLAAGSDAHSNIGFHLFGDDTGNKILDLKLDNYRTVFRIVRTHILVKKDTALTTASLLDALREGHSYIGFDVLSSTEGFFFSAGDSIMGDETPLTAQAPIKVKVPLPARIVLFKDGQNIHESHGAEMTFTPVERGTYRVEVFLDVLGAPFDRMPWILSNPIYVR
jgi:hypothetical protein